ncbi:ARM repeat-containing protein [Microthyrium microscopicum]|uniref:ARM repeat-containing protein n=1 Tax=Microthyrium microscopicum TaxID=703497 RepID=A0A6A6U1W3_9PEZI|nr:ARM repeat-containing protein [Microthyrium microscopicum]
MAWQPSDEPLRQLAQYLKDSLSGQDKTAQKNAEIMLKHAKASPDFTNYLTYLLAASNQPAAITLPRDSYDIARSAAAITLKNTIKSDYKTIPDASKQYIRSVIIQGLQDSSPQIRNYSGSVITEVVRQGGILAWPHLLSDLFTLLDNKDGTFSQQTQEGSIGALLKICEDNKRALDREYNGERPLGFIYPKLLALTTSPIPKVRATALSCINVFLPEKHPIAMASLAQLLSILFSLAMDQSNEVRKQVCRSLLHVAEISPESIIPNLEGLVNYTLTQQKNTQDDELALDAAEFWICLGEDERIVPHLRPYLASIVPVLLESMVYNEEEQLRLESDYDNADEDDRAEDIKPTFATAKPTKGAGASNGQEQESGANGATDPGEMSEGEVSDDDDDPFDDEDGEDSWTLRKCSAAALDVFASYFHDPVFEVTLPYFKQHLVHEDWPYREAAVLALGAIADGCMDAVQPHLPDLTHYLLTLLQDKEPVVRQITCWTLGRYSGWASQLDDAGRQQFFEPMMDGILQRMLDSNKKVQESAASAFANLEEKATSQLKPYCSVIIRQFVNCFAKYKDRNMFILYDCVQTLAEHVGPELSEPDLVNTLMPALINRWNKVQDQSREMFPLLECLSYVASALGDRFEPFAEPIFGRCIKIIYQNLEDALQASQNPGFDIPEKDFLITSLDLLSAILQALPSDKSAILVLSSQPNMFEMLVYCMKDDSNDVRQSGYALLGDSAVYVFEQLRPYLPEMLGVLIPQLDMNQVQYDGEETKYSVVNNACWSLGEICVRQKEEMRPYVDGLLEKLAMILFNDKVPESLSENAAIALGRLGLGCSDQLAPHLGQIAPHFLKALRSIAWTEEKVDALQGLLLMVSLNPQAMESCLLELFVELSTIPEPTTVKPIWTDKQQMLAKAIVLQYKTLMPTFDQFISQMPSENQNKFIRIYVA